MGALVAWQRCGLIDHGSLWWSSFEGASRLKGKIAVEWVYPFFERGARAGIRVKSLRLSVNSAGISYCFWVVWLFSFTFRSYGCERCRYQAMFLTVCCRGIQVDLSDCFEKRWVRIRMEGAGNDSDAYISGQTAKWSASQGWSRTEDPSKRIHVPLRSCPFSFMVGFLTEGHTESSPGRPFDTGVMG